MKKMPLKDKVKTHDRGLECSEARSVKEGAKRRPLEGKSRRKNEDSSSLSDQKEDITRVQRVSTRKRENRDDRISLKDLKDAWRKEFKIKGQIGKVGDKDKLDYSSLKRQVNAGKVRGVPETDIVDAVINATTAGSDIRALL